MFCKKCGKQLKDGASFCAYCGAKVVMPGTSAPVKQFEAQMPAESVGVPETAKKGRGIRKLMLVIAIGIIITAAAVLGYFIWSGDMDEWIDAYKAEKIVESPADEKSQESDSFAEEEEQQPQESDLPVEEEEQQPQEANPPVETSAAEQEKPVEDFNTPEEEVRQFLLPTSNSEYLTMSDLEDFSQEDCRLARNELYARHGRRFDDPELQAYFDAFDWYEGTIAPADFNDSVMNEYEIANRDLIVQYEKDMGYR